VRSSPRTKSSATKLTTTQQNPHRMALTNTTPMRVQIPASICWSSGCARGSSRPTRCRALSHRANGHRNHPSCHSRIEGHAAAQPKSSAAMGCVDVAVVATAATAAQDCSSSAPTQTRTPEENGADARNKPREMSANATAAKALPQRGPAEAACSPCAPTPPRPRRKKRPGSRAT